MKGVAQLSGRLLARKGEATPVARVDVATLGGEMPPRRRPPQSFGNRSPDVEEAQARRGGGEHAPHGSRELPQASGHRGQAKRYAFTLRLDPERHRRLRLLSARLDRSAQAILVDALDELLQDYAKTDDGCACMRKALHGDSSDKKA